MLIIKTIVRFLLTIVGFILLATGSLMLLKAGFTWYDLGILQSLRYHGVFSIPLHIYLIPIIGLLLLSIGSFVIVKAFKKNLKCNDVVTLKNKLFITFIVYFLILIQCCILIFQIHELARYGEDIEEHMPTMTFDGNKEVMRSYYLGTVVIPFFSQLVLLPVVWIILLYRAKYSLNGAYTFLISCLITSFSWCASITAIIFAGGTYD